MKDLTKLFDVHGVEHVYFRAIDHGVVEIVVIGGDEYEIAKEIVYNIPTSGVDLKGDTYVDVEIWDGYIITVNFSRNLDGGALLKNEYIKIAEEK